MSLRMTLRERLAKLLSPGMAEKAMRYDSLISRAGDAYWWLGGYPDAADTLRWVLDGDRNRWRGLNELPVGMLPDDIGAFREHLERRRSLTLNIQKSE